MHIIKPVTMFFDADGVPSAGGTSQIPGVPQDGMPGAEQSDAGRQQLEEQLAQTRKLVEQRELDLRQLQSRLDSTYAQKEAQLRQQMREMDEKLQQAVTSGMDEEQRIKYEAGLWRNRAEAAEKQRLETEQQLQNFKTQQEYARAFTELGISPSELDYSDPQALVTSGWAAVIKHIRTLEAKAQAAQQTPPPVPTQSQSVTPPVQPNRMTPPQVVTTTGGTTPTVQTFADLRKAVASSLGRESISEEEMYRLAETGKINLDELLKNLGQ